MGSLEWNPGNRKTQENKKENRKGRKGRKDGRKEVQVSLYRDPILKLKGQLRLFDIRYFRQ